MTIYAIDIVTLTHTCPADPEPHEFITRRRIVHITPGGPCRTPVTVRCGDAVATIDCGRHVPSDRQCAACRTIITIHSEQICHLGYQGPTHLDPDRTHTVTP